MKNIDVPRLNFTEDGKLIVIATAHSSKHDFDFFEGKWSVHNKKRVSRLTGCEDWVEFESTQEMRQILHGKGNIDNFIATFDAQPFEGMSLRLFNSETRLWSIYWTDTIRESLDKPVIGFFEDGVGHFYSQEQHNEKDVIAVFRWDVRDPELPVWSQALSADNGETWEWNWFMYFRKS
jgi:hypothetical protein